MLLFCLFCGLTTPGALGHALVEAAAPAALPATLLSLALLAMRVDKTK